MNNENKLPYDTLSVEELRAELTRLKENLCDLEDTHSFTFGKTSVHIGAERAQSLQEQYEEECSSYNEQITFIADLLQARGEQDASSLGGAQFRS